jgi:hypothetical protein
MCNGGHGQRDSEICVQEWGMARRRTPNNTTKYQDQKILQQKAEMNVLVVLKAQKNVPITKSDGPPKPFDERL